MVCSVKHFDERTVKVDRQVSLLPGAAIHVVQGACASLHGVE